MVIDLLYLLIRTIILNQEQNIYHKSAQRDLIASCDWLFCFTVLFSLAEKKMRFRAKNSAIWEYIAPLRANRIARIISDFKMDLIKANI